MLEAWRVTLVLRHSEGCPGAPRGGPSPPAAAPPLSAILLIDLSAILLTDLSWFPLSFSNAQSFPLPLGFLSCLCVSSFRFLFSLSVCHMDPFRPRLTTSADLRPFSLGRPARPGSTASESDPSVARYSPAIAEQPFRFGIEKNLPWFCTVRAPGY